MRTLEDATILLRRRLIKAMEARNKGVLLNPQEVKIIAEFVTNGWNDDGRKIK